MDGEINFTKMLNRKETIIVEKNKRNEAMESHDRQKVSEGT